MVAVHPFEVRGRNVPVVEVAREHARHRRCAAPLRSSSRPSAPQWMNSAGANARRSCSISSGLNGTVASTLDGWCEPALATLLGWTSCVHDYAFSISTTSKRSRSGSETTRSSPSRVVLQAAPATSALAVAASPAPLSRSVPPPCGQVRAIVLAARAGEVDQVHDEFVAAALQRQLHLFGELCRHRLVVPEQLGHEVDDDVAERGQAELVVGAPDCPWNEGHPCRARRGSSRACRPPHDHRTSRAARKAACGRIGQPPLGVRLGLDPVVRAEDRRDRREIAATLLRRTLSDVDRLQRVGIGCPLGDAPRGHGRELRPPIGVERRAAGEHQAARPPR